MKKFEQVKAIREEYSGLKDLPRKSLASSVKTLADDLYAKDTHFIFELIQNAEDNDYQPQTQPRLRFEVNQQGIEGKQQTALSVYNNEVGFQEKHVRAICQVGQSTKNKAQGYIGEKGIGFKSVFRITNSPYVFSNGFRFCLPEQDEETGLGYIVPRWVEKPPARFTEKETAIILPLNKSPRDVRAVSKALREIAPETILFLQKLTSLEISIRLPEEEYEVVAEKRILRVSGASRLVELSYLQRGEEFEEEVIETAQYWLTEREFPRPSEVQHEKRLGIETRTVSVAIPLDQEIHPGKLFAYLPVWEQTGLPFLINADFLLVSSREGIREDEEWNLWLRDCIAETYTTAFLALLADNQLSLGTKISAYASIPLESHHQFLNPIAETIKERLTGSACILTLPGEKPVHPEQARLCHKTIRALFGHSADYPQYLREAIRLVCLDMEPFEKQLQEVGVEKFLSSDVTACLEDSTWVQDHPPSWLVELFRFLKKESFKPSDLMHLHLIPIDQGKREAISFSCTKKQPIYFALDPQQSKELAKIPQWLSSLAEIAFIHRELQAQLTAQADYEDLTDWLTNHLDVYPFSIANYCVDILEKISIEYENLTEIQIVDAAKFLTQHVGMENFNWLDLPIVLADGRKMLLEDAQKLTTNDSGEQTQAIVVPENYDPDAGWQHIWPTVEDRAHFIALADHYASMPEEWFSSMEIIRYPAFRQIEWRSWQVPRDLRDEHHLAEECRRMAAQSRADETRISSYVIPSSLACEKCSKKLSKSLLKFLKTQKETSLSFEAVGRYVNRGHHVTRGGSSLLRKLRTMPWLPTSKGLVAPSATFIKKQGIEEVLGNTVPYIDEELPEPLLLLLHVKTEVNVDALLGLLKDHASSGANISDKMALRVYSELFNRSRVDSTRKNQVSIDFAKAALIYVYDDQHDHQWARKDECVWEDASKVFGRDFIYLERRYPNLKDFFVGIVGVTERVDSESFARRLLALQDASLSDTTQQRVLVEKIYRELKPITKKPEQERPVWWKEFSNKVKLYSQSDKFYKPDALLVPDDGELRRIFEKHDKVEFAWRPGDDTFNDWLPFYKAFNVPLLSESVTEHLKECAASNLLEKNRFVTIAAVRMIAAWLREKKRADYDRLLTNDVFQQLFSIREASSAESILVAYQLKTNSYLYNPKSEYYPAFWDDSDDNILYYTSTPQKIQITKALAKKLLANCSELANWIELVLEAPDTKRLQHENLSVPREILAMCDKGIAPDSPADFEKSDQNNEQGNGYDTDSEHLGGESKRNEQHPEEPQDVGSTLPYVNFGDEIENAFDKDGATKINDALMPLGATDVKNPARRNQKLDDKLRDEIKNEPPPEDRRHPKGNMLEGPSKEVRSSLLGWYHGKCQICGKTWPKRNGVPFFVATYFVNRRHARWLDNPGNALCLCAEHSAQWQHAAKEPTENIPAKISALRLKAEGGDGNLIIHFKMLNADCAIHYDERHFLELRTLLNLTKEMEARDL